MHFLGILKSIEIRKLWWKRHLIFGKNAWHLHWKEYHQIQNISSLGAPQMCIRSRAWYTFIAGCNLWLSRTLVLTYWSGEPVFLLSDIPWLLQREIFRTSYTSSIFASVPHYLKSNWQMLWDNGLASSKDLSFVLV